MANTSSLGDLGEAQVLAALVAAGFNVAVPWGDNTRYDLIVDCPRGLVRVQVKHAKLRDGHLKFSTSSVNYDRTTRTYHGDADVFAVWSSELGSMYLVEVADAPAGSMVLRTSPPPSRVRTVHYAKDHVWPASSWLLEAVPKRPDVRGDGLDERFAKLAEDYRCGTATAQQTAELQQRLAEQVYSPDAELADKLDLSASQVRTLREHHRAGTIAGVSHRKGRRTAAELTAMIVSLESGGATIPAHARPWRETKPTRFLIAVAAEDAGPQAAKVGDWLEQQVGWRPAPSTINGHLDALGFRNRAGT